MDHVDKIIAQWAAERPDLDTAPMAAVGRVARVAQIFSAGMGANFHAHGLNAAWFDVLATLLRSGPPYQLSPGQLIDSTMVTSGTMTNRIDKLVAAGYVARRVNPDDSRSFLIALMPEGKTVVENTLHDHVETQDRLLKALSDDERDTLTRLLARILSDAETAPKTED
ncbi:MarR family transcriptional regulator [uncultured Roseobacter sp.]|uniref:MarR family winged helix-turn-helix transcriptional regulator n=1 Tax=uncultured Roseobacter sp. TaxID=114847 RepID=UPI0026254DEC|nr:MarR family transcriptional regulator [uncultured Roseobacter sp.]